MRILFVSSLLLLNSCSSALEVQEDALCKELALFANSVSNGTSQEVTLKVDWLGKFITRESTDYFPMATKDCDDYGYGPGHRFCRYLVHNTSSEFPVTNFRRIAMCLGEPYSSPYSPLMVNEMNISIGSYATQGVLKDIYVKLHFSTATASQPSTITISATSEAEDQ